MSLNNNGFSHCHYRPPSRSYVNFLNNGFLEDSEKCIVLKDSVVMIVCRLEPDFMA